MKTIFIFILIWYFADLSSSPPTMRAVRSIFGTTADPEARKDFERGLLLLHNFEYPDAAELFRSAQSKDPAFALAYWGEAMSYNHPIWLSQDADAARMVMRRYQDEAKKESRKLPSLDADLMASLELLYGEGSKAERDESYAEYMSSMYEKYRGNHDVAAFYSLSLLGQAAGWNEPLCNKAAEIAAAILKENPQHPGALHYYIHAEDHPEFAKNAWDEANSYAKVASYSGHALHMPSHIYLAIGLWDDVVKSNEVSWQAGVDRKESKGLTNNALNYHAHWWLAYGYLQQGRFGKAEGVVKAQLGFTNALSSPSARNHFIIMRGHYLMESGKWENPLAFKEVKTRDLRVEIRNLDRFVRGIRAFRDGNDALVANLAHEIEKDIRQAGQIKEMNEGVAQCNARPYGTTAITQTSILNEELKALHAFLKQDWQLADTHFRNAVSLEEKNGHFFGPPEILKPTHEFYGEFLLYRRRVDEAIKSFERSLTKAPGRNQSLHGLAKALALKGDHKRADEVKDVLQKNLKNADHPGVPEIFSLLQ